MCCHPYLEGLFLRLSSGLLFVLFFKLLLPLFSQCKYKKNLIIQKRSHIFPNHGLRDCGNGIHHRFSVVHDFSSLTTGSGLPLTTILAVSGVRQIDFGQRAEKSQWSCGGAESSNQIFWCDRLKKTHWKTPKRFKNLLVISKADS